MSNVERAVILLSGGLDSATTAAVAQADGYELAAISFRYGQRHAWELSAAAAVAQSLRIQPHVTVDIDLQQFGGSALTSEVDVPKKTSVEQIGSEIPVTYVPARNTVFLSLALAWAETLEIGDLFIGVNALDYSGYPDCRPEYVRAFEVLANLATKGAVEGTTPIRLHAPLIHWSKAEIIRRGLDLGVDYSLTMSCYDPHGDGVACGRCDACLLRLHGFAENNRVDPIPYAD